jgi:cysteine desulfurase
MNIDIASLTGHKFYGPKGVGAVYIQNDPPVVLKPLICGGGQERGLRAGTLPPHLVVGLGETC